MSLEKFTIQEIKLIEDFLNDAKNTSKNIKLDFMSLSGSLYKGSYDVPRGNAASENWGDRILSDNFKMSDRITFKILIDNEHIDTIDFSKNISKKILGKDIITIEIVRKRYVGNYGEYGLQYGGNMGVRIHYTPGIFFQIDMGLLVGIGLGGTAISIPMSIVGKHFPLSNRTIAMSLVTAVGSFGYFISPMYTSYSLINNGWIHTLYIFTIFLVIGLVIAFFVRSPSLSESIEKPSDQNTMSALKEAFKTKSYVLLTAGFFVCGFHITLVGTHVPTYVIDRGLETWTAAAILSLIGLFNIFGSLISGYLSTKMKKKVILAAIYALRGISICLFIFLPASNINAFIFGASFGFLWLSTVPATSGIVAHMFGTKHLGMLYGIVFLSHQIGSFFGSFLGGLFHDIYGSYDYAWYLAIALSIFAAIIHVPIKEEPVLRLKTE